jgi:hypothetical protein
MGWLFGAALALAGAPGCGTDSGDTDTGAETGDESTESGESGTSESGTSSETDTSTGDGDTTTGDGDGTTGDGDGDGDGAQVWRFIAMGDGGEGNPDQYAVANAVEMVCADTGGCDFVLYLGDNFYDSGVDGLTDQQFTDKFELPYQDLYNTAGSPMPFWIVMGNHDYGTVSNEWFKVDYEIGYTNVSDRWTMPDKWYAFNHHNAEFFGMDTTRLMWDFETGSQQDWLDGEVAASTAAWTFAFAHHPYISNGQHGNAGNFEGIPLLPLVSGLTVQDVVEESICGKVDFYLNGHDHNLQWLEPVCDTQFIVSGAAAKTTDFAHRDGNQTAWETDQIEGFFWVEVRSDTEVNTRFYDKDANMTYERAVTK